MSLARKGRPSRSASSRHPREASTRRQSREQWRIEELAGRAGASVDTIRFYQKRGLLPAPRREGRIAWYGQGHLERLREIRKLQAEGFTLAVIGRILHGELDRADLPLAREVVHASADGREGLKSTLSLDELAARTGMPAPLVDAVVREGLLVSAEIGGTECFTDADIDAVEAGLRMLETGIPLPELLGIARVHHRSALEVAEAAVALFDAHVREPLRDAGLSSEERASRMVEAFRTLLPAVTLVVTHHFRRVLLQVARAHLGTVGEPAEVAAAEVESRGMAG